VFLVLALEGSGYHLDTLLKWVREVWEFLWEVGVRAVVEVPGCESPRVWLCGRLVYEGLPDGEWALLEVVSSAARRCLVSGSAYTAIGTESHSAVTTSSDERPMAG